MLAAAFTTVLIAFAILPWRPMTIPVSSSETITSPAPSFNVTVSAETSYSRYLNYKDGVSGYSLDLANTAGSGDDIMNISAKVGISNGILNNSNYTELYSVTSFKVDETALTNTSSAVGTLTAANLDGQSWAKHIVSASFKFDGIEKSGSKDCHVTGLPYIADPPSNNGTYKWNKISSGVHTINWKSDHVYMEGSSSKQTISSPEFYVPERIDVNISMPVTFYSVCVMWIHAKAQLICRIGGNVVINREGAQASSGFSTNKTEDVTCSAEGYMLPSNSIVEVENAYTMASAYIKVYSVELSYK